MAQAQGPLPPPNFPWAGRDGVPSQVFAQYMAKLDAAVRALAGNLIGSPVQLTNAANDAQAAAAGVAVGQFYRNGSVVQVRVT